MDHLQAALANELAMAAVLRADLAAREAAAGFPNWRGRALLLSIEGRADELRAQIAGLTVAVA